MARIDSEEIITALQAAGIVPAGAEIRRVVVDLQVGWEPVIHVEMVGSRKAIKLVEYLDGVSVATEVRSNRPESRPEEQA